MRIKKVKYLHDYKLAVEFTDGKKRIANFEKFLVKQQNSSVKKYLDIQLFKQVKIDQGHLTWNGEIDIHALDIYYGVFSPTPPIQKKFH